MADTTEPCMVRLPKPLIELVKRYQNDRLLPSFSGAMRELLETHPAIDTVIQSIYTGAQSSIPPGRL